MAVQSSNLYHGNGKPNLAKYQVRRYLQKSASDVEQTWTKSLSLTCGLANNQIVWGKLFSFSFLFLFTHFLVLVWYSRCCFLGIGCCHLRTLILLCSVYSLSRGPKSKLISASLFGLLTSTLLTT